MTLARRHQESRNGRQHRGRGRGRTPSSNAVRTVTVAPHTLGNPGVLSQVTVSAEDLLGSQNTSDYSFVLKSCKCVIRSPQFVNEGGNITSLSYLSAQFGGYQKQDDSLQRSAMTAWKPLSTTLPTTLYGRNLRRNVYVGGLVPVTNVNADVVFFTHFLWYPSLANSVISTSPQIVVEYHCSWTLNNDLNPTIVSAQSSYQVTPSIQDKENNGKARLLWSSEPDPLPLETMEVDGEPDYVDCKSTCSCSH